MKLPIYTGIAIAFSFLSVSCSNTGRNTSYGDRTVAVSPSDRDFAVKAAQAGMAEVEMGNLAQQKGVSDQVKDFGRKLVRDHTNVNADLTDIAARESITLPAEFSGKYLKAVDKLAKLSGAEFDREFARLAVADHREAIEEFEKQAKSGQNQSLKYFASSNIPALRDHLSMAENLERSLPAASR